MFAKNAAPQRWGFTCPYGEKVDTRDLENKNATKFIW